MLVSGSWCISLTPAWTSSSPSQSSHRRVSLASVRPLESLRTECPFSNRTTAASVKSSGLRSLKTASWLILKKTSATSVTSSSLALLQSPPGWLAEPGRTTLRGSFRTRSSSSSAATARSSSSLVCVGMRTLCIWSSWSPPTTQSASVTDLGHTSRLVPLRSLQVSRACPSGSGTPMPLASESRSCRPLLPTTRTPTLGPRSRLSTTSLGPSCA